MEVDDLIGQCHQQACELLRQNLLPPGLMAAHVDLTPAARKYHCIFARDVGIAV